MSANTEQRKLAVIMFTDMVGYSALAQRHEALALAPISQGRTKLNPVPQEPPKLSSVPQGRPTIAQRFIAGLRARRTKVPQGRKNG